MKLESVLRIAANLFTVIGLLFTLYLMVAMVLDVREADETSGGYEYPYQGWTGKPLDFSSWYPTPNGLYTHKRVSEWTLNCISGRLNIGILGLFSFDFRPFSDRAKVVHQPQVACRQLGFDTSAWDSINDPQNLFGDLQEAAKKP